MRRMWVVIWVVLMGCGDLSPSVVANVSISASLQNTTDNLSVSVFAPRRSDDIILVCSTLVFWDEHRLDPDDSRLQRLAYDTWRLTDGSEPLLLNDVPSGENRVVYVAAYSATHVLLGHGCTDNVTILPQQESAVTVRVYPVSF